MSWDGRADGGEPSGGSVRGGYLGGYPAIHLNNNGPVTGPQVLAAIRTAVDDGSERTILDSTGRSNIDMINRLGRLGPR